MATYGTDLVVLATGSDGESGTWTEFTGWASGGTPAAETENFIQNTQSQSQTFGNPVTGKSICFDAGSDISASIPSGDVVMGWVFMGAPTNMYTYASGGHRFGIGASVANFDMWSISGDDRPPNPYGGWWNFVVDPTITADYTGGTGSAGAWRFFGSLIGDTTLGIRVKIAKGNPHAVDGLLMGRGEIYCTGTGATFTLMAADNDAVANRWGLLQDTGGDTFLWKGLMSLGQSGTSTTFAASNQTIVIDDTAKVTSSFNRIEVRHASSSITLTNIAFTAKGTVSKGQFEMMENATTMIMTGCTFSNMDIFTFLSNAAITSTTFRSCALVTLGGGTFNSCLFSNGTASASCITTDLEDLTGCTFESDGSNHAVELTSIGAGSMNWDNTLTGYVAGVAASPASTSSTGNEAIYVNVGAGTLTINVVAGATVPSIRTAGATVNVVAGTVTLQVTVLDLDTGSPIENARVYVPVTSGVNFPYQDSVTITGTGTTATATHTAHGLATNDYVVISGAVEDVYNGVYQITVTGVNTYTYTTNETIGSSPATGTIISTFVVISGLTNPSGIISDTRTHSVNQPIGGWVRKSTSAPYYRQGNIVDTIDSATGKSLTIQLSSDE